MKRVYIQMRVYTVTLRHPETGAELPSPRVFTRGSARQVSWCGGSAIFLPGKPWAFGYRGMVDGKLVFQQVRGYPAAVALEQVEWQRLARKALVGQDAPDRPKLYPFTLSEQADERAGEGR